MVAIAPTTNMQVDYGIGYIDGNNRVRIPYLKEWRGVISLGGPVNGGRVE